MHARGNKRRRKWLACGALALMPLLIGAIVNVAVAWSYVQREPATWQLPFEPPFYVRDTLHRRKQGLPPRPWTILKGPPIEITWLTWWDEQGEHFRETVGYGWPLVSMERESQSLNGGPSSPAAAILAPALVPKSIGATSLLPIRPRPLGFAVNTAMWAAPLWLLMLGRVGWRGVRRWTKRRTGTCAGCGYDLRGLDGAVCPECGHFHPAARK